ncbi:MAG: hypothetical protein GWO08_19840, partial [Gammaproteobacteria bacterium]|nr:hypothetical protein [Gammaproteobacteria bacterium]NIR95801.1 hypothetical protein [Gammaproteobacteria bacterium]
LLDLVQQAVRDKMGYQTAWVWVLPEPDADEVIVLAISGDMAEMVVD